MKHRSIRERAIALRVVMVDTQVHLVIPMSGIDRVELASTGRWPAVSGSA